MHQNTSPLYLQEYFRLEKTLKIVLISTFTQMAPQQGVE